MIDGVVRKYLPREGYGFVILSTGEEVFFHALDFFDPHNSSSGPVPGEEVEVDLAEIPADGTRLRRAVVVNRKYALLPQRGVVERFNPARGYGFIQGSGQEVFYLHRSDWLSSSEPRVGDRVHFYAGKSASHAKRLRACYVTLDLPEAP